MATRSYEHVGTLPLIVDDAAVLPGAVFDAALSPAQEAFWIRCGAIRPTLSATPATQIHRGKG